MNDPRLRYKRAPPVHYEALTYSAGKGRGSKGKRYPTQQQQPSTQHQMPSTSRRRRVRPRAGAGTHQQPKKKTDALMELFKVAASIILLSSSAYTYRDHFKFHAVNEVEAGMGMGMKMHMPATAWARSSYKKKSEGKEQMSQKNLHVDGSGNSAPGNNDAEVKLPSFVQEQKTTNHYDAYGVVNEVYKDGIAKIQNNANTPPAATRFIQQAYQLRTEFASRYGGEPSARAILQKGMSTLSSSSILPSSNGLNVAYTAKRIQKARSEKRPFTFGFAGYSVTAGRGNYFHQSFPFVMERLLAGPMKELGVDIQVINAGIGGVPSFPYGFCLTNFFKGVTTSDNGEGGNKNHANAPAPLDVVTWDFSMNEANDVVEGMEAYIRQVLTMDQDVKPMLLVMDTHTAVNRRALNERYANAGLLPDALVLHPDPATEPFLEIEEEFRPMGFQKWREFGAPPEAPGKSKHHPAVREHELIGWMIAMHFLSALEMVLAFDLGIVPSKSKDLTKVALNTSSSSSPSTLTSTLPAPFFPKESLESSLSTMLYGSETKNGEWEMNGPISCRTSFDPIVSGNLNELITSTNVHQSSDVMLPKGAKVYSKGWVLDLGDAEKKAKQQLNRYDHDGIGLGFVDSKKAYYGVFASGPLQFFLPLHNDIAASNASSAGGTNSLRGGGGGGGGGGKTSASSLPSEIVPAADLFTSIVLCESNEKRDPMACNMVTDISYTVGGVPVKTKDVKPVDMPGFSYLGRNICVHVKIPPDASISYMDRNAKDDNGGRDNNNNNRGAGAGGITVELSVSNKRIRTKEIACNVSHVIWQQNKRKKGGEGIQQATTTTKTQ